MSDFYKTTGIDFYPTPLKLAIKMMRKLDFKSIDTVLDCSAGKGNLLDAVALRGTRAYVDLFVGNEEKWDQEKRRWSRGIVQTEVVDESKVDTFLQDDHVKSLIINELRDRGGNYWAIEVDDDLCSILRNKGYRVIGSDWMTYDGGLQPSAIVMNPPFSHGDSHLIRAIDHIFSGQIVAVVNAETIKNPCTLTRQELVKRLKELNAEIEFLSGEFEEAERQTSVEVALIYIDKRKSIEDTIFADGMDQAEEVKIDFEDKASSDLVFADRITAIVQRYNDTKERGVKVILDFYKNARRVPFLSLHQEGLPNPKNATLTNIVRNQVNTFLFNLRGSTWREIMDDPALHCYLTSEKKREYISQLNKYQSMDVTESNLRAFVAHISAGYQAALSDAIMKLFDDLTFKYAYCDETANNKWLYTGWKSNSAFGVSKKVVLPNKVSICGYSKTFRHYIESDKREYLSDLDKCMSYFDGGKREFKKITDAIEEGLAQGVNRGLESEYFRVDFFKKGTLHLTFKSEDLRRRFNIYCGSQKGFLGADYGKKSYQEMSEEEKSVVRSFEGEKNYTVDPGVDPFVSMGSRLEAKRDQSLRLAA